MTRPRVVSGRMRPSVRPTRSASSPRLPLLEDNRRLPMDVVERQVSACERLLPRPAWPPARRLQGARRAAVIAGRELLYRVGNVRFRTMELHAPVFDLIVRQSFLQRRFGYRAAGWR